MNDSNKTDRHYEQTCLRSNRNIAMRLLNIFRHCGPDPQSVNLVKKNKPALIDSDFRQNDVRSAFTLAEVLITLGIIGVVAAMTLPTLINNSQNKALQAAFKKSYSRISEALLSTKNELGVDQLQKSYANYVKNDQYPSGAYPNKEEFINTYYKQLKVVGNCKYEKKARNYNNTADLYVDIGGTHKPSMLLSDGSCIGVTINSSTIGVTTDVNGSKKGPNQSGHDIFTFHVDSTNDALVPVKMKKLYSEDEIKDIISDNPDIQDASQAQAGFPCSIKSKQKGNGMGCAWYALNDINPETGEEGYWKNLP